ncbi:unnamed protein product [Brassica oleracea var. botrytis]
MASKSGQRVRLVKCPKCLKILQEDEDVPVYQCGGCSAILQSKRRSIAPKTAPSAGETEGAQAATSDPPSEPETNNVSSRAGQDTVLPSRTGLSSGQEDEKDQDGSMEATEKQIDGLELSEREESNERSLGDYDKNEGERDSNSNRLKSDMESVVEATQPGTSSGSLNADHMVAARASSSSSDAYRKLEAEISPDTSPVEEEQDQEGFPANKTSSAYDGSKSSSDEREDQDENEQWNALQNLNSDRFEVQRYPQNFKEQGGSSSSTFSDNRPSGTTTYNKQHQNRSLQLEGPGGRLARRGRRHVSEQLRPDVPLYPREPYTRPSPSYPSHDVFDRYSRAHSLQMPPPYESVDHMYHNNARASERGQGSRFSGETTNDTRNHPGWYSGQVYSSYSSYSASPQRLMEQQPEYYHPRWSHEMVSEAEDHQRTRLADLQDRRRQPVAKRHIRPTAGGAPFVTCYSCSQNLQLPVDFIIFKRNYHLLRCGRCTTVLRFSLQSRTHLVPAVTHDINANRTSNSTPENPSSSAAQGEEEEEVPVGRGSPLHRLMGYSTVSQVFKASQHPPSV